MIFTEDERSILSGLADVLIPAGDGLPSASEAGVAADGLDQVLTFRPDLGVALKKVLAFARGKSAFDALELLGKTEPDLFAALTEFVPGAYFINQEVRTRLNYHGQSARRLDHRADYLDDGLLQEVINRGAIYRPTPRKESRTKEKE